MLSFLTLQHWVHLPFHSSLEALGASISIILSFSILQLRKSDYICSHSLWISSALVGMGVLDGYHAFVNTGENFVWLHSAATFVGGMFFAFVWLPIEPRILFRQKYYLPMIVLIISVIIGSASILFPNIIPIMLENGTFSKFAKMLNIFGGCLFLAASLKFGKVFIKRRENSAFVFSSFCFLFGLAGLIFNYSELWDASWWLWHFVRFLAYLIILYFIFLIHKKGVTDREQAVEALEQAYEILEVERNKLTNIFDSMEDGVYIVNKDYDIEYLNPILEKEFGPIGEKKCYIYFHDRNKSCPWCKNKEVFAGKTVRWDWYSPKTKKHYDLIDSPLYNYDGSVSKLEIFRDITEQKHAEEVRKNLIKELQKALEEIKTLRGILPICSYCKKIRDDNGYWEQVDVYIHKHSEADISHSICQDCMKEQYPEEYEALYLKKE